MPIMPRTNKKSSKIAFRILGIPGNMVKSRKAKKDHNKDSSTVNSVYYEESLRIAPRKF